MHLSIIPPQHSLPLVSPLEQKGGGEGGSRKRLGKGTAGLKKNAPAHIFLSCYHVLFVYAVYNPLFVLWGFVHPGNVHVFPTDVGQHGKYHQKKYIPTFQEYPLRFLPFTSDNVPWHARVPPFSLSLSVKKKRFISI